LIRLRHTVAGDFQDLIAPVLSLSKLAEWVAPASFQHPLGVDQPDRHLALADGRPASPRIFTAIDRDGQPVSDIEIALIRPENGSASLCRVLVYPAHRGRSLCCPLVDEALRVAFDDIGLRRIDLRVYSFNQAAIRCS
jgi:RimJ/RimL family protein N-acetyltransferase